MGRFTAITKRHQGLWGDGLESSWTAWKHTPEGYKFLREFHHQCTDYHVHVGLYGLIPPPLPTVEEAAILLVAANGTLNARYSKEYGELHKAVQRKLEEED